MHHFICDEIGNNASGHFKVRHRVLFNIAVLVLPLLAVHGQERGSVVRDADSIEVQTDPTGRQCQPNSSSPMGTQSSTRFNLIATREHDFDRCL